MDRDRCRAALDREPTDADKNRPVPIQLRDSQKAPLERPWIGVNAPSSETVLLAADRKGANLQVLSARADGETRTPDPIITSESGCPFVSHRRLGFPP